MNRLSNKIAIVSFFSIVGLLSIELLAQQDSAENQLASDKPEMVISPEAMAIHHSTTLISPNRPSSIPTFPGFGREA